jgi:hypothetical protein
MSSVAATGDCVRLRLLRFAPTHIHRPYSRRFASIAIVVDTKAYSRRLRLSSHSANRRHPDDIVAKPIYFPKLESMERPWAA